VVVKSAINAQFFQGPILFVDFSSLDHNFLCILRQNSLLTFVFIIFTLSFTFWRNALKVSEIKLYADISSDTELGFVLRFGSDEMTHGLGLTAHWTGTKLVPK
jgi:hypothetical protein